RDLEIRARARRSAGEGGRARRRRRVLRRAAECRRRPADLFESRPVTMIANVRSLVTALAVSLTVATNVVAAPQGQASTDESLARLRAALTKPESKLTLRERVPDFSVHIETRRPMQDIFDRPPWATDPVGWQPPGLGFDLLSLVRYVAKS